MRPPRHITARTLCVMCTLSAACVLAACNNEDDEHLWGGALSPTQTQKLDMGRGPMTVTDSDDGDSEDPFTDNPNYPFVEEPWWEQPDYSGG